MLKKLTLISILIALVLASCNFKRIKPSDTMDSKKYSLVQVRELSVISDGVTVYYYQSGSTCAIVEGPTNMVEALNLRTNNKGRLNIELKSSFDLTSDSIKVIIRLFSPQLNSIEVMNKASVIIPDPVEFKSSLYVNAFSEGIIHFDDFKAENLYVSAYQNSIITFEDIKVSNLEVRSYTGATVKSGDNIISQ